MHNENKSLIEALSMCAVECTHCAAACLDEDDVSMLTQCIRLDLDCADLCIMAAKLITRGSVIAKQFVSLCADMCRLCADECSKHVHMQHCKDCADKCSRCEAACLAY